jgi:hypothetical protein
MMPYRITRRRLQMALVGLVASLALTSCTTGEDTSNPVEPNQPDEPRAPAGSSTGLLTVWTSDPSPSPIEVSVDGVVIGTLTRYWTSAPTCGSSQDGAALTVSRGVGSHIVSGRETQGTKYWAASSIVVAAGGCSSFALRP